MSCEKSERWMMDALDGILTDADRQRLVRHLELCAGCRADWEALNTLEKMLANPPILQPAPGFASRVEVRLARFESQRRTLLGGLILLGAAAALCLVTVPSLLNGRNPLEAYATFLVDVYDLLSYGMLLMIRLVSALWITLDTVAKSFGVSAVNLLTYAAGTILAVAAWWHSVVSRQQASQVLRHQQ